MKHLFPLTSDFSYRSRLGIYQCNSTVAGLTLEAGFSDDYSPQEEESERNTF